MPPASEQGAAGVRVWAARSEGVYTQKRRGGCGPVDDGKREDLPGRQARGEGSADG